MKWSRHSKRHWPMAEQAPSIALGTVQFGMPYGITNPHGQTPAEEVGAILELFAAHGGRVIDTAIGYGKSEQVLGQHDLSRFRVVSKVPEVPDDVRDITGWMRGMVEGSLVRLGVPKLAGLLLHRPQQLAQARGAEIYAALAGVKKAGLVEKIGASIYDPATLETLGDSFTPDIVQCPFNAFDQRILRSKLAESGVELHVRSAFLQGILLTPANDLPPYFRRWAPLWARWEAWQSERGQTPLQACLGHALSAPQVSQVVLGVNTRAQLAEIYANAAAPHHAAPSALATDDPELINPALWKTT